MEDRGTHKEPVVYVKRRRLLCRLMKEWNSKDGRKALLFSYILVFSSLV